VVTIISYFVFVLGVSVKSFKFLSFNFSKRIPVLITLVSAVVYALLFNVNVGGDFTNLMAKGLVGGAMLLVAVVLLDARIREQLIIRLKPSSPGTEN